MTYRPAPPHRAQPTEACARCGFPAILLVRGLGIAHATTAGAAACAIARQLEQITADGWNLRAPTTRKDAR